MPLGSSCLTFFRYPKSKPDDKLDVAWETISICLKKWPSILFISWRRTLKPKNLEHHCLKLSNAYSDVYTLRSRCPLCEPNLKTVSLRKFDRHRLLADIAVVNIKRVTRNFKGCTTKEPQIRNLESVWRLPKNAKTTLKLLSEEGPGSIYQLCYGVPTKRIKRIWTDFLIKFSRLKLISDSIWHL